MHATLPDLVTIDVSGEPLDGAAPVGAKAALETYWAQWAAEGPEAWERWLPAIGEIADGIGAIVGARAGSVFLGPNVSVLQAALATSIDFSAPRCESSTSRSSFRR